MQDRPTTRCECAGLTFGQIAAIAEREGLGDFPLLCKRTGCAETCTACAPELRAFLARREDVRAAAPARA